MSLIPCSKECRHQEDGYCKLETGAVVTNTSGGCPHYVHSGGTKQNGAASAATGKSKPY